MVVATDRVRRLLAAVAVAVACVAPDAAGAATPLPGPPVGKPGGRTTVAGMLRGQSFTAVSAIATEDVYGTLNLYLFQQPHGCGMVSVADGPFLWVSIDTRGAALRIGTVLTSGPRTQVVATLPASLRPKLLRKDVSVTLTRLDGRVGSRWAGRLTVRGTGTRVSGSFSAKWCGRV